MNDLRRWVLLLGWIGWTAPALAQTAPTPDDSRAVAALTTQYLATIDPEHPGPALAYWVPEVRAQITPEIIVELWRAAMRDQVDLRRVQPLAVS